MFEFDWEPAGNNRLLLRGDVTEHAKLLEPIANLSSGPVRFDLAGIRRINSLGARLWIQMMRTLKDREVILERCPPAVIDLLGCLQDFRGHASIASVLLPYSCDACHHLTLHEESTENLRRNQKLAERSPCETCGRPVPFDDLPERYLSLVR